MSVDFRPHHHQLVRIRIRKRRQQDGIDNAEYCGIRTDAQHEGQQGNGCEPRSSAKTSECISKVSRQGLNKVDSPRVTTLFLCRFEAAELQAGLASCLLGRESRGEILSRLHLQMRLQFRLEFFVHLTTEEQCAQPKKSVLPPPHIKPSLTPGQWRQ